MANSTFRATVDKILTMVGQVTTLNGTGDFDSDTMDKPQQQAKAFVDFGNRLLAVQTRGRFTRRRFVFTTVANQAEYLLDPLTTAERLVKDSWFDLTHGNRLQWLGEQDFIDLYRVPEINLPVGIPVYWRDLYANSLDQPGPEQSISVLLAPVPAGAYVIQYDGYLKTVALQNATDEIIWPVEFEHLLWSAGNLMLENALGEGKTQPWATFLEPMITQVKQLSIGPPDQPNQLDLGISIPSVNKGTTMTWNNYG